MWALYSPFHVFSLTHSFFCNHDKLNNEYMSPVSPVFHTVEAVRLFLNSEGTNTPTPEIKVFMLESRALKFFFLIFSLCKQN